VEDFESLSEQLARITMERDRLRDENARLRGLLNRPAGSDEVPATDDRELIPEQVVTVKPEILEPAIDISRSR